MLEAEAEISEATFRCGALQHLACSAMYITSKVFLTIVVLHCSPMFRPEINERSRRLAAERELRLAAAMETASHEPLAIDGGAGGAAVPLSYPSQYSMLLSSMASAGGGGGRTRAGSAPPCPRGAEAISGGGGGGYSSPSHILGRSPHRYPAMASPDTARGAGSKGKATRLKLPSVNAQGTPPPPPELTDALDQVWLGGCMATGKCGLPLCSGFYVI